MADADGEVYCLNGGFYGNFTITFSVTIMCVGPIGQAGATLNGINLPAGGVAVLDGIDIDQRQFGGSSLTFNGAGTLILRNSKIRNSTIGLNFVPTGPAKLVISNTTFERSDDAAIIIKPPGAIASPVKVDIDGLRADGNLGGILVQARAGVSIDLEMRNSQIAQNSDYGFISGTTGGAISAFIENCSISNNANVGVYSSGANSFVFVSQSVLARNNIGWAFNNGGALISYRNNVVRSVTAIGGPSATAVLQ